MDVVDQASEHKKAGSYALLETVAKSIRDIYSSRPMVQLRAFVSYIMNLTY
jgi:hypothetical protein